MSDVDYLIIGAGSAGCVLAERLSRDPANRVLLLEAGGNDGSMMIDLPKGFGKLQTDPTYNWYYQTEADETAAHAGELWLRGKVLGGTSAVNGMLYVRGQPQDYDGWQALGNPGWGWDQMSRIFGEIEASTDGGGGPMRTSRVSSAGELTDGFIAAGKAMGLQNRDLNHPEQEGVGYVTGNIWKGKRQSASAVFLRPARKRPNLQVVTGVVVHKIGFDGRRATHVSGVRDGQPVAYRATREIIVSAGALESPALLMRSGIGPAAHLQSVGVDVIADRAGVGGNLREHRLVLAQYRINQALSLNRDFSGWRLLRNALRWQFAKSGPLASPSFDCAAFVRTDPALDRPDAQIVMAPFSLDFNASSMAFEAEHGIVCFGYPLRPESQGRISLRSADPSAPLMIQPNYLSAQYDRDATVRMFRYQRRLMSQQPIAQYVTEETRPGPAVQSDDEIIDLFKRQGTPGYHVVGTCKMGVDSDVEAVVDAQLRVHGIDGLRVVDCSVMPTMVSGNTNAPVMAMAWRASELILAGRQ